MFEVEHKTLDITSELLVKLLGGFEHDKNNFDNNVHCLHKLLFNPLISKNFSHVSSFLHSVIHLFDTENELVDVSNKSFSLAKDIVLSDKHKNIQNELLFLTLQLFYLFIRLNFNGPSLTPIECYKWNEYFNCIIFNNEVVLKYYKNKNIKKNNVQNKNDKFLYW